MNRTIATPIGAFVEDPVDRFHRLAAEESKRSRYLLQWTLKKPPTRHEDDRRRLAREAEDAVADMLKAKGFFVTRAATNAHFDLLVNGLRVEVKASRWSGRYEANLRDNDADALAFACKNGRLHFFVIPFDTVKGLTVIKVTKEDPADYVGRWSPYLEAWATIDDMIANGVNHWQRPLL